MSHIMPRRVVVKYDPLTEHLQNLQPEQVDALEMMQGVYSNQVALSAAVVSMQRHAFDSDNDVHELADSVAANTLPRLQVVAEEMEKELNE
ncbi:conserved hypothetical protein [Vibrio crassostreae]|uniref:Uncharacterized protein n=1 Tax=Vibrio tasmaniensis TaxID=212663 RepID=A0A0H3ZKL0_9VIBR|nr:MULTISPECIES: hypothetical protein [Vibrio]AKN36568.1 hypothetical protein [Vibrio tasmaniensis]EDK27752.1 hypothetical protein VSWAT3_00678 [Vibrionales bacterium SWAT-3]MCG9557631.1 hypothetical protein [Vibrio kanaloae]CAK1800986.1 conserved hypothetical protein [Vibrio crassostreae]CAK1813946.1 conserved hypothetical protein [Vibrio crassostreae]